MSHEPLRAYFVLGAMIVLIFLINVDYTAVNIAMLPISKDTGADLNDLQWLLSGYVLAWASLVIPAGQMADIYGKRRLLLYGVTVFTIASILCGLLSSTASLIAARILQGFGGALFVPSLYALVFDCFPPEKRGFAIGMLGVGAGIGLAIGPTFGGYILSAFGWRWIFLINGPLCLITIAIIMMTVAKEPKRLNDKKVDWQGGSLLGLCLATFMFALNQAEIWGITDTRLWIIMAIALGLGALFLRTSRSKTDPLIPKGLFKNKPFVGCMLGFGVYCYAFSTILVIVGLYLQNIMNLDPYEASLIFLAMTLSLGVLSPFGGSMVDKIDPRIPICGGFLLLSISILSLATFDTTTSQPMILATLFCVGLGMGLSFPALNAMMMKVVDPSILSTASGTFIMCAGTANSLGVVISTSLFTGVGGLYFSKMVDTLSFPVSNEQLNDLLTFLGSAYRDESILQGFAPEQISKLTQLINGSLTDSMTWIMGSLCLLTASACFYCYKTLSKECLSKHT